MADLERGGVWTPGKNHKWLLVSFKFYCMDNPPREVTQCFSREVRLLWKTLRTKETKTIMVSSFLYPCMLRQLRFFFWEIYYSFGLGLALNIDISSEWFAGSISTRFSIQGALLTVLF